MYREIVITDLTRFSNEVLVCVAGIDRNTGECIRPMDYLRRDVCERLNVLPGSILGGDFTPVANCVGPHTEDERYSNLKLLGAVTSDEFRELLEATSYESIADGFDIQLQRNQKHIPIGHDLDRSIISIQIDPERASIIEDQYNPGRIKISFTDNAGTSFRFLSITDLGFYRYAADHHERDDLEQLNDFIHQQDELFLRVGLSRAFQPGGQPNGYWMQVNGIYTFPEFMEDIRSYE